MENKFYQDNLEYFLKERADNFRMYPTRRVWHGIYNDLHPSRKWPSLIVWILLISSMTYIGVSNKNEVSISESDTKIAASFINETGFNQSVISRQLPKRTDQVNKIDQQKNKLLSSNVSSDFQNTASEQINMVNEKHDQPITSVSTSNKQPLHNKNELTGKAGKTAQTAVSAMTIEIPDTENNNGSLAVLNAVTHEEKLPFFVSPTAVIKNDSKEKNKSILTEQKSFNSDKEWIEDFAFHNKVSNSKWKTNVALEYYFTPSVGYRVLSMNTNYSPSSSSLVAPINNTQDYNKALSQSAAINMELGSNIVYSYSKNWNIKAGLQLNYTNYAINAYELKHPTMTTLLLNDPENGFPILDPRSTDLANSVGVSSKKLNNNTYQLSLPFGADLKLAGKHKLKWYAGATIQPTYVIGGNAYLISSDLKNYVTDKSLMRKWNLNAGFETFLSYKTLSGITINAGPQFRYQILSTYNKQYTYDENLYNFGLKIGIITKF